MAVAMESVRESERRMEKFDLEGVNSVDLKDGRYLIVLRGLLGKAYTFMSDRPAELLFGDDKTRESGGLLKRLKDVSNSFAGRFLQAAGVGCAAMAGACGVPADVDTVSNHNAPEMSGQFGTAEKALTGSDISHFGTPQPVPWSKWDDGEIEITKFEGKDVLVFSGGVMKEDGVEHGSLFYVECDGIQKCIDEGVPQEMHGLQESFDKFWVETYPNFPLPDGFIGDFREGTIFQDKDGQHRLIVDLFDDQIVIGNINKQDGVITVSDFELPPVNIGSFSGPVPINGVPHLFHDSSPSKILDLYTWEEQESGFSAGCSSHSYWSEEPSWIVAQKGKYESGKLICEFVSAESLDALINNIGVKYLKNINDYNKTALGTWGARIGQNVFIYVAEGPKGTKLYYALIEPYCGDGKVDEGETFANCPQDVLPPQDAVTFTDVSDAGSTGQETGVGADTNVGADTVQIGDVLIDTASLDAALEETMKEVDGAVGPDSGADGKGADTQPDTQTDTALSPDTKPDTQSNTDTLISLCDDVEFEGDCDMSCDEPNATFTGKCTATVNVGGKSAKFEIDGEYTLDLLEKAGTLLEGSVEVDDKGIGVTTNYGDYESTPTGTVYGGEGVAEGNFDLYKVWVKEGQITVSYNGNEIAVLNAGDEVTYDKGEPITPVQPDVGEDASQTDASEGTDAGNPDLGGGKDAGSSVDMPNNPGEDTVAQVEPKKGGGGGGGCSVSPAETSETPKSGYAILFAVGAVLSLICRRFPHIKGL